MAKSATLILSGAYLKSNKILDYTFLFTSFILAWPIFLDLSVPGLFINNVSENAQILRLGIPFPLGPLLFLGAFISYILLNAGVFFTKALSDKYYYSIIIVPCFFLCLISGMSFINLIQLFMFPFLLFASTIYPIAVNSTRVYTTGSLIFVIMHLYSVFYLNGLSFATPVNRIYNWETFFSYQIYSGLISYSSVLSLLALLLLLLFLTEKAKGVSCVCGCGALLVFILASYGAQRMFFLELICISLFSIYLFFNYNKNAKTYLIIFIIFIIFILNIFVIETDSESAVYRTKDTFLDLADKTEGSDTLNRLYHIKAVGNDIIDRWPVVFYKGDGRIHSGAHNVFLDLISGIGLVGAVMYLFFLVKTYILFIGISGFSKSVSRDALILCGILAFLGSMVNLPLTQPIYFINLLYIMLALKNVRFTFYS